MQSMLGSEGHNVCTNISEMLYSQKFSPVSPPALMGEILLLCVDDFIEDMVTFTALEKIYSTKYFCNTKVAGLGEILVQ